jgi:molybdopterin-binding protein
MKISARNTLKGTIKKIEIGAVNVEIVPFRVFLALIFIIE